MIWAGMKKGSFTVWVVAFGVLIAGVVLWFGVQAGRQGAVGVSVESPTENNVTQGEDGGPAEINKVNQQDGVFDIQRELEAIDDSDAEVVIDEAEQL